MEEKAMPIEIVIDENIVNEPFYIYDEVSPKDIAKYILKLKLRLL